MADNRIPLWRVEVWTGDKWERLIWPSKSEDAANRHAEKVAAHFGLETRVIKSGYVIPMERSSVR